MKKSKTVYNWDEIIEFNVAAHNIHDKDERNAKFDEIDKMIYDKIGRELNLRSDIAKGLFEKCVRIYGAKDMTALLDGVKTECNMVKYWLTLSEEEPPANGIELTWEGIRKMADNICKMTTKPNFARLPNDHIEDYENKSVRWNEEFLADNHRRYDEEAKRLCKEKNDANAALDRAIFDMVFQELSEKISHSDCRKIVKNAFNEYGHHDMYHLTYVLSDFCDVLSNLECFNKQRGRQYVAMNFIAEFEHLPLDWNIVRKDYDRCRSLPVKSSKKPLPNSYCFDKDQTPKWNDQKREAYNEQIRQETEDMKKARQAAFRKNEHLQEYMLCCQLDWLFTMNDIKALRRYWNEKYDGESIGTLCEIYESECSDLESMDFYQKLKPIEKRYPEA